MTESESSDINFEWKLVAIGRGSFATVSILLGRPVAFKQVLIPQRTPELEAEFGALCSIYEFCTTNSFFQIPRPLAYYDPSISTSFTSPEVTPPGRPRVRARRPLVTEGDFVALKLSNAAYAMNQVLPLPLKTAGVVRSLFYPPTAREAPLPNLCRLYFGKVIESKRPVAFFNSANFPLDLARYNQVLAAVPDGDLPTPEEISHGMGEMLGRLHWLAGYDGRDIEFVLGGLSFSGVEPYVIDFNQVVICSPLLCHYDPKGLSRCVLGRGIKTKFSKL